MLYEGRIVGVMDAAHADMAHLGLLMSGATLADHVPRARGERGRGMTAATRRTSPRIGLPYTVSLEPRLTTSRWLSPALTAGALVVALLISAVILAVVGADPVRVYLHILGASLGSVGVLSDTLVKATPLILTGLACALAFRMRLWNIGAEGQLLLGAWAASAVVLVPLVPAGTPGFIVLPVMLLAGFLGGAAWGLIPGALRARFGVNEIIATLMLNSIAFAWVQYWVFGPWTEGGFQLTEQFPVDAWLPRLSDLAEAMPFFRGLTIHAGFLVALAAAGVVWWIVERSSLGLRDQADRRQPARRALCRDPDLAADPAGVRGLRRARGHGGHGRGLRGRAPAPGQLLAGLRLHGDHRGVPGEVPSAARGPDRHPVRRPGARRPRDPAIRACPR